MTEDADGEWGDAWIYEDKVIYVQKKFVAIPKVGDARRRRLEVRQDGDDDDRHDVRRHAPRLLGRQGAQEGLRAQLGRRVAAVPDVPAVLRPDVLRGRRQGARARVRAGLQRLDGRGVVRPVHRRQHPAVHHAAVGCRARGEGDQAQRRTWRARGVLLELPTRLDLPSIHTGYWDPMFDAACNDTGTTVCMHVGSSSTDPSSSADAPAGVGEHGRVQQLDGVARRLPLRRDHGTVPEAEDRVLRGPDRLDPVRARARRHGVGAARRVAELQAPVPRAAVDLLLRPRVRLLHVGPARREVARRGR